MEAYMNSWARTGRESVPHDKQDIEAGTSEQSDAHQVGSSTAPDLRLGQIAPEETPSYGKHCAQDSGGRHWYVRNVDIQRSINNLFFLFQRDDVSGPTSQEEEEMEEKKSPSVSGGILLPEQRTPMQLWELPKKENFWTCSDFFF